jgi:hypothetical protein
VEQWENACRKIDEMNNEPFSHPYVDCHLLCSSSAEHLSQLFTGFGLLERQGLIRLRLTRLPGYRSGVLAPPMLKLILDGRIKVAYDANDSNAIDLDTLSWCDFYFKRSFDGQLVDSLPEKSRIFPLGFNYPAYGPNDYSLTRLVWGVMSSKSFPDIKKNLVSFSRLTALSSLLKTSPGRSNSGYTSFEDLPRFDMPTRVIFFARLWDPEHVQDLSLKLEREKMNQMRVEIIRKMQKHYGDIFWGGLEPTDYAAKYFGDCVVQDPRIIYKKNYVGLLRQSSIGIATAGLQKSNGWKVAEYIAGSKAIVSEELCYEVSGDFQATMNYLPFSSPDQALDQVALLLTNKHLLYEIMVRNFVYYHLFLRPDMLIWNTIQQCKTSVLPQDYLMDQKSMLTDLF